MYPFSVTTKLLPDAEDFSAQKIGLFSVQIPLLPFVQESLDAAWLLLTFWLAREAGSSILLLTFRLQNTIPKRASLDGRGASGLSAVWAAALPANSRSST
jgi:hypothetical protein